MRHCTTVFLIAASCLARTATAQSTAVTVEFDHAAGAWRLITARGHGADTTRWTSGRTVTLIRDVEATVRVVNTNTALYRLTRDTASAPLPEMVTARSFIGRLVPYFPEVGLALAGPSRGGDESGTPTRRFLPRVPGAEGSLAVATVVSAAGRTEDDLARLDAAIFGPNGVETQLAGSLTALEQMRSGRMSPEQAAAQLRQAIAVEASDCASPASVRIATPQLVLTTLTNLLRSAHDLNVALEDPELQQRAQWAPLRDSASMVSARAQHALADFDTLITNAYRAERIVRSVATACSWMTSPGVKTDSRVRTVSLRIDPRPEPEFARVADRGPAIYSVTVRPARGIHPSIGVSALVVPDARYPTYATRAAGSQVEVYESGIKDQRFAWGFSGGLTWPGLDRGEPRGLAFWIPELTVGNTSDSKFLGIGSAVSMRSVKLGVGALWMRHTALNGAAAGTMLPNATYLRTVDSYGRRLFYVSLSLFETRWGK